MINVMEESARPVTLDDIKQVEARIGVYLPKQYVEFLMRYNGGRPTPNAFPIEGLDNNPFGVVQLFFGIDDPIQSSNIDWNYETMQGRIPESFLPIACDDGGDLICLALFGDNAGSVFFWDCQNESLGPGYENVYRIADGFDEFLEGLTELPTGNGAGPGEY